MIELPAGVRSPFDELVGTEWQEVGPEQARGRVPLRPELTQPLGLVHGGVYATLAESICSFATAVNVWDEGMLAVGMSNHASFLRPARGEYLNALAIRRHHGRTTWIWDVDLTDDEGRLCAIVRMTIAVRPRAPE